MSDIDKLRKEGEAVFDALTEHMHHQPTEHAVTDADYDTDAVTKMFLDTVDEDIRRLQNVPPPPVATPYDDNYDTAAFDRLFKEGLEDDLDKLKAMQKMTPRF